MEIKVCIGSSCHLKGAPDIVKILERLIVMNNLSDKVTLKGSFCMGECTKGVCIMIGDKRFYINPSQTEDFFNKEVMPRL